jgi:DeoR/GlpR family transcriptional regulator of sugar metabolism
MVRAAKRSVVLADSTKFHRVAEEVLAPRSAVHTVATDSGILEGDRRGLLGAGVEARVVEDQPRHQP